jgi:hypothetical protein
VTDKEGNAVCSPQRSLKCKKAAITAANLLIEGVTSERERNNKEVKIHSITCQETHGENRGTAELYLQPRRQVEVDSQPRIPAALSPGMTQHPLYRRLGNFQGRSVLHGKCRPPPGIDPRTVQPVTSRYTDYVIPAHETKI